MNSTIILHDITFDVSGIPLYKNVDIGLTSNLLYKFIEKPAFPMISDSDAQINFTNKMEELYNQSPVILREKKIDLILSI